MRLKGSWLDDSKAFYRSGLPFVHVLVVALELVLARKAVVATVFTPRDGAWVLFLVGASTMLGLVVTSEVTKGLSSGMAVLLETTITSWLAVVASPMLVDGRDCHVVTKNRFLAVRKAAYVSVILIIIIRTVRKTG